MMESAKTSGKDSSRSSVSPMATARAEGKERGGGKGDDLESENNEFHLHNAPVSSRSRSIRPSNLYKYDKVGKTDTLQMYPRPAATTLCRVATLVCPVSYT